MDPIEHSERFDKALREPLDEEPIRNLIQLAEPARRASLREDLALHQLLRTLPDAPASSNFTSQVLAQLKQAELVDSRAKDSFRRFHRIRLFPRLALSGGIFLVILLGFQQYEAAARAELARSAVRVCAAALALLEPPLPPGGIEGGPPPLPMDVLQHFEAFEKMPPLPPDFDAALAAVLEHR